MVCLVTKGVPDVFTRTRGKNNPQRQYCQRRANHTAAPLTSKLRACLNLIYNILLPIDNVQQQKNKPF